MRGKLENWSFHQYIFENNSIIDITLTKLEL